MVRNSSYSHGRTAFTLIEVLVVVAIIALLIAILLPSLARSREQARATVCLTHLKQQGTGISAYSADNRGTMPSVGAYRYTLLEGAYYVGRWIPGSGPPRWAVVNTGLLYPKYVGSSPDLYYCPNNRGVEADGKNGKAVFVSRYRNQGPGDPEYHNAHDLPGHPYSSYAYALPVATTKAPRDAGAATYPEEVVRHGIVTGGDSPYWGFLTSNADLAPDFLSPSPQQTRGRHAMQALMSDMYFAGFNEVQLGAFEGYHLNSYNVLFSDLHAKRVLDPQGQIHKARLSPVLAGNTSIDENGFKVYKVWEYFSANP